MREICAATLVINPTMAVLVDVLHVNAVASWSQEVQTATPSAEKATQCIHWESKGGETQTDLATFCSAGCQTEAAFPDPFSESVCLTKTGVTCEACCKSFPQEWRMHRHWRLYHSVEPPEGPQEPYYCPYCSFCSFTRKLVTVHERTHVEADAQSSTRSLPRRSTRHCPQKTSQLVIRKVRPQRLAQKTKGVSHQKRHTRSSPQVSDDCQKSYVCKKDLATHVVIHMSDKPFECDVCHQRFPLKQRLVAHIMNHMSNRTFECDICLKGFILKHHFSAHQKLHTESAKVYSCSVCRESFAYKGLLADHEKKPHISVSSEKPYECIVCHEVFPQRAGLLDHHCMSIRRRMVAVSMETASLEELE